MQTRPIPADTTPVPVMPTPVIPAPAVFPPVPPPFIATPPAAAPDSPGVVTRRFGSRNAPVDPVVGWLVCIQGPDKGRDWRLHAERNFIGRAANMDVAIAGDETISRDRHAILTFDPKKSEFWVQPGESTGMVYLNGEAIYVPQSLRDHDIIELGHTKLVFVPFVSLNFQW